MPTKLEQVQQELAGGAYTGLRADQITDAMNQPVQTSTTTAYRTVSTAEVYDAISATSKAKLSLAAEDYAAAANEAQRTAAAAGVAIYERLSLTGGADVTPGSVGRSELDAAASNGYLTSAEVAAIVALGTTVVPVLQNCWQRWGWDHSVTIGLVEEALSG